MPSGEYIRTKSRKPLYECSHKAKQRVSAYTDQKLRQWPRNANQFETQRALVMGMDLLEGGQNEQKA